MTIRIGVEQDTMVQQNIRKLAWPIKPFSVTVEGICK